MAEDLPLPFLRSIDIGGVIQWLTFKNRHTPKEIEEDLVKQKLKPSLPVVENLEEVDPASRLFNLSFGGKITPLAPRELQEYQR